MHGLVDEGRDRPMWWTLRRPFHQLSYHGAYRMFARVNAELGANWSLHDLRHTAAYRMARDPDLPLTDVQWVVRPADIDATVARAREGGYDPGDIAPLSRRAPAGDLLEWRLTPNRGDRFGGLAPALIDWQDARHPTADDLPQLGLVSLAGHHPDPPTVRRALAALDFQLDVTTGSPGLVAVLDTPNGRISL